MSESSVPAFIAVYRHLAALPGGSWSGDLVSLQASAGVSETTVCVSLKRLHDLGAIDYSPGRPGVSSSLRITGPEPAPPKRVGNHIVGPEIDGNVAIDYNALREVAVPAWPYKDLVKLCEGWVAGLSTNAIAKTLLRTKNAVVGKSHRLTAYGIIQPRASPIIRDGERAPRVPRARAKQIRTLPALASVVRELEPERSMPVFRHAQPVFRAPPPRPVVMRPRLFGRVITCCWPLGEPGTPEFRFCDVTSEPGRPYCEEHVKVAYVRVGARREDVA